MRTKENDLRGVKCRIKGSPLLLLESTLQSSMTDMKGYEYGALLIREDKKTGPFLFYLDLMKKHRLRDLRKEHNLVCVQSTEDGTIYDTPDRAFQRYCETLGLKDHFSVIIKFWQFVSIQQDCIFRIPHYSHICFQYLWRVVFIELQRDVFLKAILSPYILLVL